MQLFKGVQAVRGSVGRIGGSTANATYVKVRDAGRIVLVAVIVAVGVNGEGRREVLGMARLCRAR